MVRKIPELVNTKIPNVSRRGLGNDVLLIERGKRASRFRPHLTSFRDFRCALREPLTVC